MRSTHTGEQPRRLFHLCYYRSCKWVVLTHVFLVAGRNESRAGDLADVIIRPVSQRSAWQMFQTGRSGQLWCHEGEYVVFGVISVWKKKKSVYACGKLALSLHYTGGMRSRRCQQPSRRGSAARPPTPQRAPGSLGCSDKSCLSAKEI